MDPTVWTMSPRSWRFSRDPIGERGGVNLAGFVGNGGTSNVDRLGLIGNIGLWKDTFPKGKDSLVTPLDNMTWGHTKNSRRRGLRSASSASSEMGGPAAERLAHFLPDSAFSSRFSDPPFRHETRALVGTLERLSRTAGDYHCITRVVDRRMVFEHSGVPDGFTLGELLRGERLAGSLAPDVEILLCPTLPALPGRTDVLGRDAVPAPPGFLLLASALLALLVGEIEPGPPAPDPVDGSLVAMMALGAGDFGRDVYGGSMGRGEGSLKGVLVFVN